MVDNGNEKQDNLEQGANQDQGGENKEGNSEHKFNVNDFTETGDSSLNEDGKNAEDGSSASGNDASGSDDDDSTNDTLSWDSLGSSTSSDEKEEGQSESDEKDSSDGANNGDSNASSNNDLEQKAKSDDSEDIEGGKSVDYSSIAERLGVENDQKAVEDRILSLQEENEKLKSYRAQSYNNEKIQAWQKLKTEDDEALVRKSLKSEKMSDEDAEKQIAKWQEEDMLSLEANKVRRRLDGAIEYEQNQMAQSEKEQEAQMKKDNEQKLVQLRESIDSTDEMFGMKMSKDPEKLKQVRNEHLKYVVDGEFANEISQSPEALLQVAWLWKHREAMLSQMNLQGKNTGRKEMLDMIENTDQKHTSASKTLPPNPDQQSKAFDIGKFTG